MPFCFLPERTFPERLKKLRIGQGYTQKQLSLKAGVCKDLVYRWERQYHGPRPEQLRRVAVVLGVSPEYLHSGVEKNHRESTGRAA